MKRLFLFIALAMFFLAANAQEVKEVKNENPVVACLQKAMHITDLQAARSDLQKKAKACESDSIVALAIYKKIMTVEMRIAQLSYELREELYSIPDEDKNCNEMDFVEQIMHEMEK